MEPDLEMIMKLLELSQMFTNSSEAMPETEDNPNPAYTKHSSTDYESSGIRMMKAAMPYLDHHNQRMMSTMLRLIEIQKIMESYTQKDGTESPDSWRYRLLSSIRPHMEGNRGYMLDILIKLIEIRQILNMMEDANGHRCSIK